MGVSRRQALTGAGGLAIGALAMFSERDVADRLDASVPLPFYGSAVSAIRPDRSAPGVAGARVVWSGPPRDTGSSAPRRLALTFDDGPHPDWTPTVLRALRDHEVPATFFCVGRNVRDHAAIHEDSPGRHELANHTFDHQDLGRFALDRCRDEIDRTSDLIESTWGVRPRLFRPPYGHLGGAALLAAAEAGLTTVLWSAQMHEDAFAGHPDGITEDIAARVAPGTIVLAHDTGSPDRRVTIDHLGQITTRLRDAGWELVTVSALLDG